MNYALEAIQLTKQYNQHTALKSLDLQIPAGEIFCLLGQNGAGKTTTINLFLGFIEPTSGKALINGTEVVSDKHQARQQLAYIPEIVQLYGNLNGLENLDFFNRLAGFKYTPDDLKNFLNKAGLQETAHNQRLSDYSKGMRQKVGIAIALAKNASVILMDEPTSGLDPKATMEFNAICKELSASGKTILMATHDLFNATSLGHRVGIMRDGHLIHTAETSGITAEGLQQLYFESITG
jgi:ABC-2 type transport system ATP-binding protein